ncbi:MAG: DUF4349 domain-containing protein [Bacteroidales bacterium]|nr:DUF4349 domain-containing protein [Bacteroidales bacterium]
MKRLFFLFFIVFSIFIFGCSHSDKKYFEAGAADITEEGAVVSADEMTTPQQESTPEVSIDNRKLIKEGILIFETEDLNKTKNNVTQAIKVTGAYVSNEQEFSSESRNTHYLEIRVPSIKFDTLVELISKDVSVFDTKDITLADVTEEFLDIQARLKTKKELETRYLELLSRANNVREILEIEREITNLRGEIESIEGRLQYMSDRISLSTLKLTYYKELGRSMNFFKNVGDGFKNGAKAFVWVLIGLVYVWPFLLIAFLIVFLVRRRRNKKKKQAV